ncbi:hypothetical protein DNL40_09630 [Xylanimonas oleitrophica]|uniref:Uncharacterized protein n=1 Tax=Xylanimonas oleitrophica TaxID=2607479 RepID=A0A2W5XSN8_9MICO|nr:hypothetical protein [Xylanimonas oleitrophica]PZR52908.1 hypothetical protein DNL40_09630 [Xylanimonas oleitrophica]
MTALLLVLWAVIAFTPARPPDTTVRAVAAAVAGDDGGEVRYEGRIERDDHAHGEAFGHVTIVRPERSDLIVRLPSATPTTQVVRVQHAVPAGWTVHDLLDLRFAVPSDWVVGPARVHGGDDVLARNPAAVAGPAADAARVRVQVWPGRQAEQRLAGAEHRPFEMPGAATASLAWAEADTPRGRVLSARMMAERTEGGAVYVVWIDVPAQPAPDGTLRGHRMLNQVLGSLHLR